MLLALSLPVSRFAQIGFLTVPFLMCYGPLPVCDSFNMTPFALLVLSNAGSVMRYMSPSVRLIVGDTFLMLVKGPGPRPQGVIDKVGMNCGFWWLANEALPMCSLSQHVRANDGPFPDPSHWCLVRNSLDPVNNYTFN